MIVKNLIYFEIENSLVTSLGASSVMISHRKIGKLWKGKVGRMGNRYSDATYLLRNLGSLIDVWKGFCREREGGKSEFLHNKHRHDDVVVTDVAFFYEAAV